MKSSKGLKGVHGLPWWWSSGFILFFGLVVLRGLGFEPWSGKIPQAMEQPNLHAATLVAC